MRCFSLFFVVITSLFFLSCENSAGRTVQNDNTAQKDADISEVLSSDLDEVKDETPMQSDEDVSATQNDEENDVEVEDYDIEEASDSDFICVEDRDCPEGYGCNESGACESRSNCEQDSDCPDGYYCSDEGNWSECKANPSSCEQNSDCDFGYRCNTDSSINFCEAYSECSANEDCSDGEVCVTVDNWKECREDEDSECSVNEDCGFGYKCDTSVTPTKCESASECETDAGCSTTQVCTVVENWKECQTNTSPQTCSSDADCPTGSICESIGGIIGVCRSMNECSSNDECETGEECKLDGDIYKCVDTVPCTSDAECGFGFSCNSGECVYANECSKDEDCGTLKRCLEDGNIMTCQTKFGGVCTKDSSCEADEYCDLTAGLIGTCKSRNQCYIDVDCGDGMRCESNGTYNECISASSESCLLDLQCDDGWVCKDYECKPQYEGMCTEIEGKWTVLTSDCTLVTTGMGAEFIPKDGCNGDIVVTDATLPAGTFTQIETRKYDVVFGFLINFNASITSVVMTMEQDNGSCSATLIKN